MRSSHNPTGTLLVAEACDKWTDLPSRTLARKLVADNPGVWSCINAARAAVMKRRGRSSYHMRQLKNPKELSRCTAPQTPWNPDSLPKSDEKEFLPYVLQVEKHTRALVMGDIHLPYHNTAAVKAAIEVGRKEDCRLVILNGDTLDFHKISRFLKDPRARSVKGEIDLCHQLLDALEDAFPKAKILWKDGNHDERYDHYIRQHAPELYDLKQIQLPDLLGLKDRGIEYVTDKRPIYVGYLSLIHGHEYPTPVIGPVNAARGLFLRTKGSAMVNHHHQTSEHTETTLRGKMLTTWSVGCLCELHPEYARFNKWNHGFATVEVTPDGEFDVSNYRFSNGKVYK